MLQLFVKKENQKGFTLIELLVVIAIIGILSSIGVVGFNSVRNRAKNTAIKGALEQMRPAAENWYDTQTTPAYTGWGTAPDYTRLAGSVTANGGTMTVQVSATGWCGSSPLVGTGAGSWCVDYTGYSGSTASCDGTNYDCASP